MLPLSSSSSGPLSDPTTALERTPDLVFGRSTPRGGRPKSSSESSSSINVSSRSFSSNWMSPRRTCAAFRDFGFTFQVISRLAFMCSTSGLVYISGFRSGFHVRHVGPDMLEPLHRFRNKTAISPKPFRPSKPQTLDPRSQTLDPQCPRHLHLVLLELLLHLDPRP
jgi:hypothetical protein